MINALLNNVYTLSLKIELNMAFIKCGLLQVMQHQETMAVIYRDQQLHINLTFPLRNTILFFWRSTSMIDSSEKCNFCHWNAKYCVILLSHFLVTARRNTVDMSSDEQTVLRAQNNRHCNTTGRHPRYCFNCIELCGLVFTNCPLLGSLCFALFCWCCFC